MTSKNPAHSPIFRTTPTISRTPVRLSFGGGGTDLKAFYAKYGGLVISATIDKYFFCVASARRDSKLVISSADYNLTEEHEEIGNLDTEGTFGLIKAVVSQFRPPMGLRIHTVSDIPHGSGLGLSGAATVGTIKAVSALLGKMLSAGAVAELASIIEIDELKRPIGKQDQYASAFGGLNEIRFAEDEVTVTPLWIKKGCLKRFENWAMLFFTGKSRNSATILSRQTEETAKGHKPTIDQLQAIKMLAEEMGEAFLKEDFEKIGHLIDASWQAKRQIVSSITSSSIDELYEAAKREGALGGKITGAGGGGFLLLICPPSKGPAVEAALSEMNAERLGFGFVSKGTHIIS
ncbi:MAG: GHMP kinase [Candidatus Coatesbacteria bacterium]|nr:GHMP kinase [Candidatus Coatesbacteria bacterium]